LLFAPKFPATLDVPVDLSRRPPPFWRHTFIAGFSFDSFGLCCVALFTLRIKRVDEKLPAAFAFWGAAFGITLSPVFSFRAQILQVGGGVRGFLFSPTAARALAFLMNFTLLKGNCE
jgi:hypothetical protein